MELQDEKITLSTAKLAFDIMPIKPIREDMKMTQLYTKKGNMKWGFHTGLVAYNQSLLQRKLRELYGIYVIITPSKSVLDVWHYQIEKSKVSKTELSQHYNSYEEALETGLYEALKLIQDSLN